MTQREDDWARIVIGWIARYETQMDEAYRVGDGRGYTAASRWRDEMRSVLTVVDPTAMMRFSAAEAAWAIREFGVGIERAGVAVSGLNKALEPRP